MSRPRTRTKRQALASAACLGIMLLTLSGCKNSTGPDENKARLFVRNNIGIAIDIYMDGVYQFFLEQKEFYYIENVTLGTHLLEAKKKGTATLLKSQSMDLSQGGDYTWTVTSAASIVITNHYGETLSVYGDGTYQGDVTDQGNMIIESLPYGEHLLEAKRPSQSEVLASTRIEVLEDKQYTWTITK